MCAGATRTFDSRLFSTAAGTSRACAAARFLFRASLVSARPVKSPRPSGNRRSRPFVGLREKLREGIQLQLEDVSFNGHPKRRIPGNLNLSFAYVDGEALMMAMRDIAVSSGSACTSASVEPSYVLRAIGLSDELARSSLRFGLGRFNTEEEIDFTIVTVVQAVQRLRSISPAYALAKGQIPE